MKVRSARRVPLIVALVACVAGVPVGFAVAKTDSSGPDPAPATGELDALEALRDDRRLGLAHIAASIEKWGDDDDADDLAAVEAELEALGGAGAAERAQIEEKLERALTVEEYGRYLQQNAPPGVYERHLRQNPPPGG